MLLRIWLKKKNGFLEPIEVKASSKKEFVNALFKNPHFSSRKDVHKIDHWTGKCWKSYKFS